VIGLNRGSTGRVQMPVRESASPAPTGAPDPTAGRATPPVPLAIRAGWPLVTCLFASGAAALIYEVVWLRQLGLVMGHTAYALSTVLTSFLGGLALGAYAGGRWAKNGLASPRFYAAIELGVAVAALLMPVAIAALDPVFGAAYRRLADGFVAYN